jgi:NTE family protein
MLLIDGGTLNNVPADVVRAMGADVVIAIDIGSPLLAGADVGRSFLTILNQTMGLITRANMAPQLAAADLVLTPDVAMYGTLEFSAGYEIIAKGEAEARRFADRLRPYALSEEDYAAWKRSRHRERDPIPTITTVRVEGNARVDSRILAAQVRTEPGALFSADAVRGDLSRLFGLGDFETVDAELEPDGDGTALIYRVREKPWGPTYLRLGLAFEADGQGSNSLALLSSVNRTRINARGAEWKTELQLGSEARVATGFYQPLSFNGTWFVEPAISYERLETPIYVDRDRVADLEVRKENFGMDLGYAFGQFAELRLGLDWGWVEAHHKSGVVPAEYEYALGETFNRAGVSLSAVVDRLDSATLPKNGSYVKLTGYESLESLGADDDYTKIELKASRYWTRTRHTLFGVLNGGISPGDTDLPIYDQFWLGGFNSLSAFERGELRGDNFGLVRLGYYYRLGKVLHIGGFGEAARVASLPKDVLTDPVFSATAMLVADTAFGPLYLAYSVAEESRRELYFTFGRSF